MSKVIINNGNLYLSYSYVKEFGVSYHTIKKWADRTNTPALNIDGDAFISFHSIPAPSKAKLPTEAELLALLKDEHKASEVSKAADKLKRAQINNFNQYRNHYRDTYGIDSEASHKLAMKRAVWERLMELYQDAHSTGYNGGLKKGALVMLHNAYNRVYPGQYKVKQAFLRAINTLKSAGIDTIVVDKRKFDNGNSRQYNELHYTWINGLISIGKAYTAPQIRAKIAPMCLEAGQKIPSLSWIKSYAASKKQHSEYASRYGADASAKSMPYAEIQAALHADKQWQVDAWTLPFYYKNNTNRLNKLTLVVVKDAYSKKIVGYCICQSENRISILDAFQDAIANTGCLPFEIVVDNHAFNRTKEAENFITEIQKIGVTWTVTENPQQKSIIERGFKTFGEQFCKEHYGYKGQGVRTRDKNGLTSPEMLQQFIKAGQILTEQEIQLIAIEAVLAFNKTKLKSYNKSPEQLYHESDKPARFDIDLYERLRILTKRTEYRIRRNQINITIAGQTYHYQLSADKYRDFNDKKVAVRYDTPELIYLFDLKNDRPICALKQKDVIHGALADQTEHDQLLMAKNKGRIKGIIAQSRKHSEDMIAKALALNPEALDILNRHTVPKDVKKMAETDEELKREIIRKGLDLDKIETVTKKTEITNPLYLAKKRSRNEDTPFTPKNHKISLIPAGYVNDEE